MISLPLAAIVTPPGQSAHTFSYDGVDMTRFYTPPSLGAGNWATQYRYKNDHQLTQVIRPDGGLVNLNYGSNTGRLDSISTGRGRINLTYVASGQNVAGLGAYNPDENGLRLVGGNHGSC